MIGKIIHEITYNPGGRESQVPRPPDPGCCQIICLQEQPWHLPAPHTEEGALRGDRVHI